jgi:DnaJ-class molecular chaperone
MTSLSRRSSDLSRIRSAIHGTTNALQNCMCTYCDNESELHATRHEECPACGGDGSNMDESGACVVCELCRGEGEIPVAFLVGAPPPPRAPAVDFGLDELPF